MAPNTISAIVSAVLRCSTFTLAVITGFSGKTTDYLLKRKPAIL
ncbi:hypothetical protein [Phormidesmis sp. 146-33]